MKTNANPERCSVASGSAILWEEDGPDRIRGYMPEPKTTLFIIERNPKKPYRGRMTGALIPDEEETPDGILANALISWLQGVAAPGYLREFEDRISAKWQKRSGDLYELAVTLKKHASEAQAMYGVHAEELIADADRVLSDVNSNSSPNTQVTDAKRSVE